MEVEIMDIEEIKRKLINKGYCISPNYRLILENEKSEYALADIRVKGEVVLPWYNKIETKEVKKLGKILIEEKIPFRDAHS
jgi:hypothetical protein